MKIAPLADVKARLSAYLDEIETDGPIIITRNGKPAAVLLAPMDDDDLERLILSHSPRFRTLLAKSKGSMKAGRTTPHNEFWKTVAKRPSTKRTSPKVK